jgi:hypothetical protein
MHRYQQYNIPQYESNDEYNMESDMEMENPYPNAEFNYEAENEYEMIPGLEINDEMEVDNEDNEYADNNETNDEYNQYETAGYEEMENPPAGYRDEMEAELEYVTNENEFSNWVNEIVVKDRRSLKPTLNTPIGRRAVRHLSSIASRTLPYLGKRKGGWLGPFFTNSRRYNNKYRPRPANWNRYRRHPYWRNYPLPQQPYPYPYTEPWPQQQSGFAGSNVPPTQQQPGFTGNSMPLPQQQQPGFSGSNMAPAQEPAFMGSDAPLSSPQPNDQDGSFKKFVLDTIKNLSQQIAEGNEGIAALKNSITSSAATNLPSLVQPKTDSDSGSGPKNADEPKAPTKGGVQGEYYNESEDEYNNEAYAYNMETENEITEREGSFNEETEMELAAELLSLQNEQKLDHFLGGLLKKAVGAVSGLLDPGQSKILKGILKTVVKKVLPKAGAVAGTFFGGPVGGAIGGKLGTDVSNLFELELEGMSNEDREFEVARSVIRFGGNAARRVADNFTGNPQEDVRLGVTESAMRYAPGLLRRKGPHSHYYGDNAYSNSGDRGTWLRRGNKIIIENI